MLKGIRLPSKCSARAAIGVVTAAVAVSLSVEQASKLLVTLKRERRGCNFSKSPFAMMLPRREASVVKMLLHMVDEIQNFKKKWTLSHSLLLGVLGEGSLMDHNLISSVYLLE